MNYEPRKAGFSLTEMLIAIAILATGLLFVAGTFPVGIYFTVVAAEKTTAAVVADEAFAKIKLYGVGNPGTLSADEQISVETLGIIPPIEFVYPSTILPADQQHQYSWSAMYKRIPGTFNLVQVTVFVNRKVGTGSTYWPVTYPLDATIGSTPVLWPQPVSVNVVSVPSFPDQLKIVSRAVTPDENTFINDDYKIVDDKTGHIYRVVERNPDGAGLDVIRFDRIWQDSTPASLWVVPPPVNGGRWPCVGIYQRVIRF